MRERMFAWSAPFRKFSTPCSGLVFLHNSRAAVCSTFSRPFLGVCSSHSSEFGTRTRMRSHTIKVNGSIFDSLLRLQKTKGRQVLPLGPVVGKTKPQACRKVQYFSSSTPGSRERWQTGEVLPACCKSTSFPTTIPQLPRFVLIRIWLMSSKLGSPGAGYISA